MAICLALHAAHCEVDVDRYSFRPEFTALFVSRWCWTLVPTVRHWFNTWPFTASQCVMS